MNTANITLTSTVLVASLGLALGLMSAPAAQADPADQDGCHTLKDCGGGDDCGTNHVTFSVWFDEDAAVAPGPFLYGPDCPAQTPASSGNKLYTTAIFPRHDLCATLTTSLGSLTDDIIIQTVTNRSGDVIGVQVTGQDFIGEDGIAHESDVLLVTPIVMPDGLGFILHVHADDVLLWKLDTHRPRKNSKRVESVGTFSLGDMIYSPDP